MLFALKVALFIGLGISTALTGPCCTSCKTGHTCESSSSTDIGGSKYPQLLVFVSFSMPLETLKALANQVNAVGGAVIFRGLVSGKFKDTALKLKELGQEALIDPTLFKRYGIKQVPTFVLQSPQTHDRLVGNVSLAHVLEQFSQQGESAATAQVLLKKLKATSWEGR